jgi:hypothetical protein
MRIGRLRFFAALSACALSCAPVASPAQIRLEQAKSIAATRCEGTAPGERVARLLGAPGLLGVEPLIATVPSYKGPNESRLVGAALRYTAPPGVTPTWLQRDLECHQADVVLGRTPLRADDPYVAPDDWLGIEVTTVGSALVIQVRARSHEGAEAAITRARRLLQPVVAR